MEFFVNNSGYVVLVIAVLILAGILWYLWRVDARIARLERRLSQDRLEGKPGPVNTPSQ